MMMKMGMRMISILITMMTIMHITMIMMTKKSSVKELILILMEDNNNDDENDDKNDDNIKIYLHLHCRRRLSLIRYRSHDWSILDEE